MSGALPLPDGAPLQGGLTLEEQASLGSVSSIHRDVSHVHELAQVAEEGMLVASLSGMPQSLELKSGSKRKRTQCGKCGEEGHNSRTCKLEYQRMSGNDNELGSDLSSLKFINKKAKKDKKRNSIRKLEKDRPWPSIKTRLAAKGHYPTKLPDKRPCTWCFNRRCGQKKLTKYHCEPCKVDLCAAPCFKEFHTEEKCHSRKSRRNRSVSEGDLPAPDDSDEEGGPSTP
eukprot:CAMPEP_0201510578 /NCGR_PEP_ID=MMETSP0161_2-20130828/3206_1 /ASSEMBLY_ACC=CAM_ASM_000251 /TAXON_ID=180227 /ORGANISM="Neoparamoeba aestuarina, Strain SoJaBio B1-5/56/2" /LENGTH=227 /DNA_ID=CAMNT_0047905769 /DNA_START=106 /DNA_END=789 /DNA_ORIENTATION=-